jgi:hypothetical protein
MNARDGAEARFLLDVLVEANDVRFPWLGSCARGVAETVVPLINRPREAPAGVDAEVMVPKVRGVETKYVCLLNEPDAARVPLQARREDDVEVPVVRGDAFAEARERGGDAELDADIAIATDDREAGPLESRGIELLINQCEGRRVWWRGRRRLLRRPDGRPKDPRRDHHRRRTHLGHRSSRLASVGLGSFPAVTITPPPSRAPVHRVTVRHVTRLDGHQSSSRLAGRERVDCRVAGRQAANHEQRQRDRE